MPLPDLLDFGRLNAVCSFNCAVYIAAHSYTFLTTATAKKDSKYVGFMLVPGCHLMLIVPSLDFSCILLGLFEVSGMVLMLTQTELVTGDKKNILIYIVHRRR